MMEQWQPLGVVGIITAFNFPVAVWAWNSALAAVCGDATLWKPSEKTPLTAIACIKIAEKVCRANGVDPAIFSLVIGDGPTVGELLTNDRRIPLISATGSTRMGRRVGEVVAKRFGRSLLELGGNNAIIVAPSADLKLALRAYRLRRRGHGRAALHEHAPHHRARVHQGEAREIARRGLQAGAHRQSAGARHARWARSSMRSSGGRTCSSHRRGWSAGRQVLYGGERLSGPGLVCDALHRRGPQRVPDRAARDLRADPLRDEATRTFDEAIAMQNGVPQGLSSSIFTTDLREAEVSSRRAAATAASPTSTSAPAAPRSAAPSAARRRPAAAARAAATRGRPTCAGRPTPSTIPTPCRWRRASSSPAD
jgi:aldehyde dehydrogenase (NAD+)